MNPLYNIKIDDNTIIYTGFKNSCEKFLIDNNILNKSTAKKILSNKPINLSKVPLEYKEISIEKIEE